MDSPTDQEILVRCESILTESCPDLLPEFHEDTEKILSMVRERISRVMGISANRPTEEQMLGFVINDWKAENLKLSCYGRYCKYIEERGLKPVPLEEFNTTREFKGYTTYKRFLALESRGITVGSILVSPDNPNKYFVVTNIYANAECLLVDEAGKRKGGRSIMRLSNYVVRTSA
jgi:hypothetical protein